MHLLFKLVDDSHMIESICDIFDKIIHYLHVHIKHFCDIYVQHCITAGVSRNRIFFLFIGKP